MPSLSNFKTALTYGGARPSLFKFDITTMGLVGAGGVTDINLYCNVSAIPPLTVTPIEKQYFGRTVKIPGDIVYGDLATTVLNAEDYSIRNAIEAWMDHINSHKENKGISGNSTWVTDGTLTQYDKEGDALVAWEFIDMWPQTIAELPLSYDTASDIEQFDVTWAYNYYKMSGQGGTVASSKIQN